MRNTTSERSLWQPEVQSRAGREQHEDARSGLQRAWQDVWSTPLEFYKAHYESAGLTGDTFPDLDEIPLTTKAMLRADEAASPPFGTHRSVGPGRAARVSATTGTTGAPWLIFYTASDLDVMTALQYQHSWRVGMRPGQHFAHSWPGGLYPTAVLGGRHFLDLGILEIPVGPPFTPEQAASHVSLWQTLGIDALMCTGSQLLTYDDAASSMGVDLADVLSGARLVIVEASCQFEAPRARIERTYGVKIHNISGAAEVLGFVTSDCEHHTGLHIPVGHHVIQVCDPVTGREVPDGERGTLVASSFDMDAYCLRYDLEDIVVGFSDPCPCGQVGKRYLLLGRAVDRAVVSGRSILPIDVQLALEPLGAPEFLLQAGACNELTVRVESDAASELQKGLEESLGIPVHLDPVPEGSLPHAAFKPRRILQ